MATVYISAKLPKVATDILDQAGLDYEVYDGDGLIDKDELLKHVGDVKILITPLSTQVDKDVIDAAPNLKLIANFGAGVNNIDTAYARQKGVDVTNTPAVSSPATAEIACGLMIALSRRIVEGDHLMRTKGFSGWAPLFFLGNELGGKTLGIVGLGSIGKMVAERMKAFNMKIIYTQRHRLPAAVENHYGATFMSLDDLLKQADVVTLHCPLTAETKHMIDADQLGEMKPTALLINCARGPVINEAAILSALQNHQLGGAALDVYEKEPEVADDFKQLKNVILTPHIGNASVEARDGMGQIVANNAVAVTQGKTPQFIVNN